VNSVQGEGKCRSDTHFISKAGEGSTPTHHGHVTFPVLTVIQQDAFSPNQLHFSIKTALKGLHSIAENLDVSTGTSRSGA
jgi:hypothetical protein